MKKVNIKTNDVKVIFLSTIILILSLIIFSKNILKTESHHNKIIIDFEDQYQQTMDLSFNGNNSSIVTAENEFGLTIDLNEKINSKKAIKTLNVKFLYLSKGKNPSNLVLSFENNEQDKYYNSFPVIPDSTNKWVSKDFTFDLPNYNSNSKNFKLYFWNPNKETFYVDDITIQP